MGNEVKLVEREADHSPQSSSEVINDCSDSSTVSPHDLVAHIQTTSQFICFWRDSPQWAKAYSFTKFLDHTQ